MGITISIVSFLFSAFVFISYLLFGNPYTGWTSLAIISSFIGGIILISLGIISEYLWRILEQVRPRPAYVIEEVIHHSSQHEKT